ncbi:aminotransferase class V-fold PLP-dependent enzyme (plasmid) [Bosea vestrisii]|uniref:aminotransferase class V-fold PLP-dependent enzyme n=1 Tax=Bosea vestrisii TaxID=151416 RepID=UPI0024DF7084|nr:aminotransferase class V-fold PLP-dependent enzyme [Bosea vestrisii]WID99927.1 aminotransferase class V-fold PLP-dependent enzyme [Bosea vestrisii]
MAETIRPIDSEELARLRADTPGLRHQTFLLSCGASLMPRPVHDAMRAYLDLELMQGGYGAAETEAKKLDDVYPSIARLLNASPDEIALVENATVAWQLAFQSFQFHLGDAVITAEAEYAANYVMLLQARKRYGIEIRICPSNAFGEIDVEALSALIDSRVRLIALTWIPTNGGLANPAAEVGRIARAHGVPYLLDACQAVGQLPIDVEALGCDFLAGTARKFLRGPRGAGFLYVNSRMMTTLEPPMIDHYGAPWVSIDRYELRPDARRYESWENNYAARIGMGIAADYAIAIGLDRIESRCNHLARRFRDGLGLQRGARLHDLGQAPSAIVSFTLDGVDSNDVVSHARSHKVSISTSMASSTRIDAERRNLRTLVRVAPHYFNDESEVDHALEVIGSAAKTAGSHLLCHTSGS